MAMGMSAFPSFMTQATPATQPLINAEPAVAAQTEQNPQVGQVMPGVQGADAPVVAQNGPSRDVKLTFAQIAPPPGSMVLRGINPNGSIEFGMRSDEVVTKAMLNLEYTPSPSLLPVQSQLKVYLNDELMGVLPVTKEQLGKKRWRKCPLTHCLLATSTVYGWSLSAIIRTCAKTGQHHALAGCWAEQWTGSDLSDPECEE